jgi:membrane protease subunit HflK
MYLETMERVLGSTDKIILDSGAGGVVPYLPLNELNKSWPAPSSNSSSSRSQTQGGSRQ